MAQQDTLIHPPHKMRRVVKDTAVTEHGTESRYECSICQRSAWRPLYVGTQSSPIFLCNGAAVATVLPMPPLGHPPDNQEIYDLLRQVLRDNPTIHPNMRLRIISVCRRLRSP